MMRLLAVAAGTALIVTACSAMSGDEATTPTTSPPSTSSVTGSTAAAGTTAAGTTEVDDGSITLLFTGDMLPSDALQEQAGRYAGGNGYDFRPMLVEWPH